MNLAVNKDSLYFSEHNESVLSLHENNFIAFIRIFGGMGGQKGDDS